MAGAELPVISQYLSNVNPSDFYYGSMVTVDGSDRYAPTTDFYKDKNNWMPNHSNVYTNATWSLTSDRFIKMESASTGSHACYNTTFCHHISASVAGKNVTTVRYDIDGVLFNCTMGISCGILSIGGSVYRQCYIGFSTREKRMRLYLWNGSSYGMTVNGSYVTNSINYTTPIIDNFSNDKRNLYSIVLKISRGTIESVEPSLFINNKFVGMIDEVADTAINFTRQCHPDIGLDTYLENAYFKIKSLSLLQG